MKTSTEYKTLKLDRIDGLRPDKNKMKILPFSEKALNDRKGDPNRSQKTKSNTRAGKKF